MTSTVTCGYAPANWELNSAAQNACQVYAALEGKCNPAFTIADVTSTSPPYMPNNDACSCNIVAYNLMAGCAWCQSSIQTTWWLTIPQWSGNCTTATFDATGIPASVSGASSINIPAWALAIPSGTTWSPSDAQLVAESATPSASSAIASSASGTRVGSTSNPFAADTSNIFATYTGPFSGDEPSFVSATTNVGRTVGIAVGVTLGLYALTGLIIGLVYYNRQKTRQAWYGPMAQYYRDRGMGMGGPNTMYAGYVPGAGASAAAPLIYNQEGYHPSASPNHTIHSTTTGTATGGSQTLYQPPPSDANNPFVTPYSTPGPGGNNPNVYQPPPPEMGGWGGNAGGYPGTGTTGGNTTSVYGTAQTHTGSVYPPPAAPPGGYSGHAEVY